MIEKREPAKEDMAVSREPQMESPSKKGVQTWSKKKKILVGIGILFLALVVIIVIIAINTPQEVFDDSQKQYIEEDKRAGYSYVSPINARGFVIDNTAMKLLVSEQYNGFYGFDDLEYITYGLIMLSFKPSGSFEEEAEKARTLEIEDGSKDVSPLSDIEIDGCPCKTFTYTKDNYQYKEYVIDPIGKNYFIMAEARAFGEEDIHKVTQMVESMKKAKEESKDEEESKTVDQEPPKEETDTSGSSSKNSNSTVNTKKREIDDMDDDEIFMVMALAEKEIKNNLTYDAKKAKFSHQPEDWYMSEQDGYYTVMTTFEAPNEYGTMQKAGAVVSFTVTSKSKDGWGYKDEDVFIEWKQ